MIRCVIVDDEPLAVKLLQDYASRIRDLDVILATGDVFAALQAAQNNEADLIFLDIQMPELTGIQFMKVLNGKCRIILTTAYEEYAIQAFDHDVVDYLLKPFSLDRFVTAVNKARERMQGAARPGGVPPPEFIFVKSEYRMIRVDLKDILYFESLRDYVAIHTTTHGKILTLQTLKSFEDLLANACFMRVHKSYIVAIDKISSIERRRVVIGDIYIPVGDTYMEKFREKFPAR